jgi:hypothetical protein
MKSQTILYNTIEKLENDNFFNNDYNYTLAMRSVYWDGNVEAYSYTSFSGVTSDYMSYVSGLSPIQ